jgi:sugar lactone lactonase YvrE
MVFCVVSKGTPDGIKVDSLDRVWVRTGAGLEIFASSGISLAIVPVPAGVGGQEHFCCFA